MEVHIYLGKYAQTHCFSIDYVFDRSINSYSLKINGMRMSLPDPCIAQISPAQKHEESAPLQSEQGLNESNLTLSYDDICKLPAHSQGIAICQCPGRASQRGLGPTHLLQSSVYLR